ncbi:hypothetical protein ACHHYP_02899 [Achlya hypogyna]|uniref:PLAC8 family protein n=1 Tax=Achlya hypogyna TaxID=1202772 RepID=A0A1V9ZRT9_ACHHY|nr:hypothetical protein ACHHYP_02899 [Achlya hypogyna]
MTTATPASSINLANEKTPIASCASDTKWKAGIFDCFENIVPNFGMAYLCPCISLAQTMHRSGLASYVQTLAACGLFFVVAAAAGGIYILLYPCESSHATSDDPCEAPMGLILIACGLTLTLIATLTYARTKIRALHNIRGSVVEDFLCVWLCLPCALAQMATETGSYTPGSCNFGPKDKLVAYSEA